MYKHLLICAWVVQNWGTVSPKTIQEESLQNEIFKNYNPDIRPVDEHSLPVRVSIALHLVTINTLNEKEQLLAGHIWVDIMWNDFRLVWNSTGYNDIRRTVVDDKRVWKPDIVIQNLMGNQKGFDDTSFNKAVVYNDGGVELWSGKDVKLWCSIDATHYPFDEQYCDIRIGKWYFNDQEIEISPAQENVQLDFFERNEEWELVNTAVSSRLAIEEENNFTSLVFTLNLKRRPLSTMVNYIIPLILLSCLNQVCFLLPIESGEKLGMCMAIFLTFAVFLTLISENLPRSSVNIPAFNIYLVMQTAISGLTIASEVFVLNEYYVDCAHASGFMVILKKLSNCGFHKLENEQEHSQKPCESSTKDEGEFEYATKMVFQCSKTNPIDEFDYRKLAVRIDRFICRCMCVINIAAITSFVVYVTN